MGGSGRRFLLAWALATGLVGAAAAQPFGMAADQVVEAFATEIRRQLAPDDEAIARYQALALTELERYGAQDAGYVLVADRNPNVQAALLYLRTAGAWRFVGAVPVATGRTGRVDHHVTPVGVFPHVRANPDYRAEGTRNSNGIRGYGAKGMRVFDLGWQTGTKGWGTPEPREIRLQMHATDPDVLEPRLGVPASKGCIRVSAEFNRFLDRHGVLDADYLADEQARASRVLLRERRPVANPGRYVVVVDSGAKDRPAWAALPPGPSALPKRDTPRPPKMAAPAR